MNDRHVSFNVLESNSNYMGFIWNACNKRIHNCQIKEWRMK
jgi:hypothetical protein